MKLVSAIARLAEIIYVLLTLPCGADGQRKDEITGLVRRPSSRRTRFAPDNSEHDDLQRILSTENIVHSRPIDTVQDFCRVRRRHAVKSTEVDRHDTANCRKVCDELLDQRRQSVSLATTPLEVQRDTYFSEF